MRQQAGEEQAGDECPLVRSNDAAELDHCRLGEQSAPIEAFAWAQHGAERTRFEQLEPTEQGPAKVVTADAADAPDAQAVHQPVAGLDERSQPGCGSSRGVRPCRLEHVEHGSRQQDPARGRRVGQPEREIEGAEQPPHMGVMADTVGEWERVEPAHSRVEPETTNRSS